VGGDTLGRISISPRCDGIEKIDGEGFKIETSIGREGGGGILTKKKKKKKNGLSRDSGPEGLCAVPKRSFNSASLGGGKRQRSEEWKVMGKWIERS